MMDSVERISTLIPKFKQQLIFLEEREKLFWKINDCSLHSDNALSNEYTNCQSLVIASSTVSVNSQSPSTVSTNSQSSSFVRANTTRADQSNPDPVGDIPFPEDYKIPVLPNALIKDVENGIMNKFGPHCSNRRILIDAIAYDLLDKYNLL